MSQLISAVIITYNEEQHIVKCLDSIKPLTTDVIIVDAFSTDDTVNLARSAGARVISRQWQGYGSARNYGATIARHDWILSVDADERLEAQLIKNIFSERLEENTIYKVKRKNIYCSRVIQFGMLHPQWKARLYHRSMSKWDQRKVHEQLISHVPKSFKKIKGLLVHHAYSSELEFRAKLEKYAILTAQGWHIDGTKPSLFSRYGAPLFHFFRSYILHLGILEGRVGWETSKGSYFYSKEKFRAFSHINPSDLQH